MLDIELGLIHETGFESVFDSIVGTVHVELTEDVLAMRIDGVSA